MSYIFISHSSKDKEYVRGLAAELRKRGFDVWVDDKAIRSGEHWMAELEQAVINCAALIVIMTPNVDRDSWVHNEIALAKEHKKPIHPLLLRGRRFFSLANLQYTDVTNGQLPHKRFYEVLNTVQPVPPKPMPPARPSNLPQVRRSFNIKKIIGIAVIIVGIIIALLFGLLLILAPSSVL